MQDLIAKLLECRVVPVITLHSPEVAAPLGEALVAGGLPVLEVTLRTPAAEEGIRAMARQGGAIVGAGTVLNVDSAKRAVDAGAAFLVSPGFSTKLVEFCLGKNIPIIPGAASATDLQIAVGEYGLSLVKFFPAESLGGVATIKALSAPFSSVKFMPTGGITLENLPSYLTLPCVLACGGSWMVRGELLEKGDFAAVRALAERSASAVQIKKN